MKEQTTESYRQGIEEIRPSPVEEKATMKAQNGSQHNEPLHWLSFRCIEIVRFSSPPHAGFSSLPVEEGISNSPAASRIPASMYSSRIAEAVPLRAQVRFRHGSHALFLGSVQENKRKMMPVSKKKRKRRS